VLAAAGQYLTVGGALSNWHPYAMGLDGNRAAKWGIHPESVPMAVGGGEETRPSNHGCLGRLRA
jgi:hypothetical protein